MMASEILTMTGSGHNEHQNCPGKIENDVPVSERHCFPVRIHELTPRS